MDPVTGSDSGSARTSLGHTDSDEQPQMGERASDMAEQAKHTAGHMVGQMKEQASARLSGQIDQAAEGLDTASASIRDAGRRLRDNDQAPIAHYMDRAADQVQRASTYLHGKDLDDLIVDSERFARRQPALFIAGAFGLGVLAARFLKSTPEARQRSMGETGRHSTQSWSQQPETPSWGEPAPTRRGDLATSPSYGMVSGARPATPPSAPSSSTPGASTTPSAAAPSSASVPPLPMTPPAAPRTTRGETEPLAPLHPAPSTDEGDTELRRSA